MIPFLILIVPFAGAAAVLIAPALVYARDKKRQESWLLPVIHVPAVLVLYWLISIGFGRPQSLGNLLEFPLLGGLSVVLAYAKVFWIDRRVTKPAWTTYGLGILLIGLAFVLRLVMPIMPE